MALLMTRPTKHPKTGVYVIRKAVPKDLRPVIGKGERVITLGTKDPAVARAKADDALRTIAAEFARARLALQPGGPLTLMEIMALCGVWYRAEVAEHEGDPGGAEGWNALHDLLLDKLDRDPATGEAFDFDPAEADLAEARRFLAGQGVAADAKSLHRFAIQFWHTKRAAAQTLERRAGGDYSPDPVVAKFPGEAAAKGNGAKRPPLTGDVLLQAWAAERRPAAATLKAYSGTFRRLARILGFDDVRRITADDVVRFKQVRLNDEKKNLGTVADDVLAAGAVCNWAVENRMIPANPFKGLAPRPPRRGQAPRVPYDDDDARRILTAARGETGWLRWLPWLLCFTGARISEIVEMRRGDVRMAMGVMVLDIKPNDKRPGKNDDFQRLLPIHPALIAEGFLDYVSSLPADPAGPLFPSIPPDRTGSRVVPATTLVGRWVRGPKVGIKDKAKAPNHSWRHRMEDELRRVRALPEVMDGITGRHNPRNTGAGYGNGFRGMPDETLKDLQRVPSPVPPLRPLERFVAKSIG